MLKKVLERHGFLESEINNHYLEVLSTMPENEWFAPTNKNEEHFTICHWFASRGMICKKDIPLFSDGSYKGMKHYFFWNDSLDYSKVV